MRRSRLRGAVGLARVTRMVAGIGLDLTLAPYTGPIDMLLWFQSPAPFLPQINVW